MSADADPASPVIFVRGGDGAHLTEPRCGYTDDAAANIQNSKNILSSTHMQFENPEKSAAHIPAASAPEQSRFSLSTP